MLTKTAIDVSNNLLTAPLVLGLVSMLVVGSRRPISAPRYRIIDLGTLIGGGESGANSINSATEVVGRADTQTIVPGDTSDGIPHAFFWKDGKIKDLGTLSDANYQSRSSASAINDKGQVVGWTDRSRGGPHAFLYQRNKMIDLGTLPGGRTSGAESLNNKGQIAGASQTATEALHAVLWVQGKIKDLGTLPKGKRSYAHSINELGEIVGESGAGVIGRDNEEVPHAFLYKSGKMTSLGTFTGHKPGYFSYALDLNDRGQVVGYAQTSDGSYHAFLWQNGQMRDLNTLGGLTSVARAINNSGQVVGEAATGEGIDHAFLWEKGKMHDLNNLIPSSSGWSLKGATDINEKGQIVGAGKFRGKFRAFLLTPAQ